MRAASSKLLSSPRQDWPSRHVQFSPLQLPAHWLREAHVRLRRPICVLGGLLTCKIEHSFESHLCSIRTASRRCAEPGFTLTRLGFHGSGSRPAAEGSFLFGYAPHCLPHCVPHCVPSQFHLPTNTLVQSPRAACHSNLRPSAKPPPNQARLDNTLSFFLSRGLGNSFFLSFVGAWG